MIKLENILENNILGNKQIRKCNNFLENAGNINPV